MGKSVAVLGLGKYGRSLAETLYKMGADVLAVDSHEDIINDFEGKCTSAVVANLENEDEIMSLGLKNVDVVVSTMGNNIAASILVVAVSKELGVPTVVAKTSSKRMTSLLYKVGADKVLDPEKESGVRSARILMSSFKDFFEIDENMYMAEMKPKKEWIGKNLIELGLRNTLNMNVIAVKEKGENWQFVDPQVPFKEDSILLVAMEKKNMKKWLFIED